MGSGQADQFRSHRHGIGTSYTNGSGAAPATNPNAGTDSFSTSAGGSETRPINVAYAPRLHA